MTLISYTQLLILQFLYVCLCKNEKKELKQSSEVEVRSVFLNCDIEDTTLSPHNELLRFQREEILKHNTLRNCKRKLAVTVKMYNEVSATTGDEFIPIDHVLGANNMRIRLLNPYILRLRREPLAQFYKIRKLDMVTAAFSTPDPSKQYSKGLKRNHYPKNKMSDEILSNYTKRVARESLDLKDYNSLYHITTNYEPSGSDSDYFVDALDFGNTGQELDKHTKVKKLRNENRRTNENEDRRRMVDNVDNHYDLSNNHHFNEGDDSNTINAHNLNNITTTATPKTNNHYILYEIGNPDLWYKAQVQLYEKITTPDRKTMWNDLTKLEIASVSTIKPLWKNQDLSIRYRSKDCVKQEDFDLPSGSLCLVLPLHHTNENIFLQEANINNDGKFMIVPINDIIVMKSKKERPKEDDSNDLSNNGRKQRHVVIRTTRTLMIGNMENLNIMEQGGERFLKLPHKFAQSSQIDIEAKADDNELIIPGCCGRLTSIVSDSCEARSGLNLQVTNTGLAPAYFSVLARECSPRLSDVYEGSSRTDTSTQKTLIPPMHTQVFILDIPLHLSHDNYMCSIGLLNGDGVAVATRDVAIKKNDRCFCIWHCECVCLGDDPKLICRNMPDAELVAAGLSLQEGRRHTRSACYPDSVTINLFVIFIGVLFILFIFGILKAFLGIILPCVGLWGLELLLTVPRKLDHYYESSLKGRTVIYDKEGWPVHPDTKKRTVLIVSKPMEFILNVTMFVTLPCILLWDAVMQIINRCQNTDENIAERYESTTKKCFSSHDMQSGEPRWRRRRGEMSKWMTPQAEALSEDIWHYGLSPICTKDCNCMQPLLHENPNTETKEKPNADAEQEDTAYVLMQIQKSKESLALKKSFHR